MAILASRTRANGNNDGADAQTAAENLGACMSAEHQRLLKSLARLVDYTRASDQLLAREEWEEFEHDILLHMDAEEAHLLPPFGRENPDEATALLGEHGTIRRLLGNIGLAFDLHTLRAVQVAELRMVVEQHAKREANGLYVWADLDRNRPRARLVLARLEGRIQSKQRDPVTSAVLTLIETCGDGERGYRRAASETKDEGYKLVFTRLADERGRFAQRLWQSLHRVDPAPRADGTLLGAMHRGWLEATSALTQSKAGSLVGQCAWGEDAALRNYRAAMRADLPVELHEIVQGQYAAIKKARSEILSLMTSEAAEPAE
jgi:uncharacterized protein (TIGR02284 family)